MSKKVLIAYATAHGSTGELAEFMGRMMRTFSLDVTVQNVEKIKDIEDYEMVLIGSPIHAGMWLPQMSRFLGKFNDELESKRNYLFITCIRVMEEDASLEHILDNYLYKPALESIHVKPDEVGVFAGKIKQDTIEGDERWLLSTNYDGKKMPGTFDKDYRDWHEVANWILHIIKDLQIRPHFHAEQGSISLNIPSESGDIVEF